MFSDTYNNSFIWSVEETRTFSGHSWTVIGAPKYYIAAIAAVSRRSTEVIYWDRLKTFGKYKSITH